jgi:pyruvate/2-oxoglutarate dehydrogenase complex dihydrolipoamide acyltransferase (E2) component
VLAGALVLGIAIYAGLHDRGRRRRAEARDRGSGHRHGAGGAPDGLDATDELVLPGNARAFTDAPIYARASGYLKKLNVDIGSRVKQGEVLAEIETPELDQQLRQARADLATTTAAMEMSKITADRWQALLKREVVSNQETDEKLSDYKVKEDGRGFSTANVKRLEDLQAFQKITAPFDGIIVARNTESARSSTRAARPAALAPGDHRQAPGLRLGAPGLFPGRAARHPDQHHARGGPGQGLPGHAGPNLQRAGSQRAHHAERSRDGESERRSPARRLRGGGPACGPRDPRHDHPRQRPLPLEASGSRWCLAAPSWSP